MSTVDGMCCWAWELGVSVSLWIQFWSLVKICLKDVRRSLYLDAVLTKSGAGQSGEARGHRQSREWDVTS